MVNVPEQVKRALFEKGWTQKKLCAEIDVSENGFKHMITNNSWKLETIEKIALALNKPVVYFIEEIKENLDDQSKQTERRVFGDQVIEELKAMFEEELRIKNQQIAGLQRTVDVLVGKSEGATDEPLSTYALTILDMLDQYKKLALGQAKVPVNKMKKRGSKVGGTLFSTFENVLANK